MNKLLIGLGFVVIVVIFLRVITLGKMRNKASTKKEYQYKKKDFFLSRAEHECYNALVIAAGKDYCIFPQAHLPTIVDNKIVGQNWRGAFSHINRKSVDFVLCDKTHISPKLAIELDDRTHEHLNRKERDSEVERILKGAGLPLLRLENHGHFNPEELAQKIKDILINK